MSSMFVFQPDEFLGTVNNSIRVVDGEAEEIPADEKRGQKTFGFEESKKMTFAQGVDLVILGVCANPYLWGNEVSPQFPMGKCVKAVDDPDKSERSWLHAVTKGYEGKTVLLVPTCCGPYASFYEEMLQKALPGVKFLFADVGDLGGCFHRQSEQKLKVARALLEQSILCAVVTDEKVPSSP